LIRIARIRPILTPGGRLGYPAPVSTIHREQRSMSVRRINAVLAAMTFAVAAPVAAQQQQQPWQSFVSVSPVFETADLDRGGSVDVSGAILRGGTVRNFGGGTSAGITLNYDYTDYSFDNPVAFGGVAPWGIVQRYGFSVPLTYGLKDGWAVGVTPSFDWFKEDGANSSDALVWGATFSAVKRYANGNVLGVGFGAFDRLEERAVIPFPIVNWRFGERWQLRNPLAAGPTGPAGLELDYLFRDGWRLGIGAAYRKVRFRLSDSGPTPNGIGEVSGVPIFLKASNTFAKTYTLNVYAGVVAGGQLRVEDPSGNELRKEDFDLAPLVGINVTARF
jgi:hypothetical protein